MAGTGFGFAVVGIIDPVVWELFEVNAAGRYPVAGGNSEMSGMRALLAVAGEVDAKLVGGAEANDWLSVGEDIAVAGPVVGGCAMEPDGDTMRIGLDD